MDEEKYNGFRNFATWKVALALDNYKEYYDEVVDKARFFKNDLVGLTKWLRAFVLVELEEGIGRSKLAGEFILNKYEDIDFDELGLRYLEEVDE